MRLVLDNLTQTTVGLDPSAGSFAFGAAQFAPSTDFGVMVVFNNVVDVFVWVDFFAILQDFHFVSSASGLVIQVRRPFAISVHVLVVIEFSQLVTRFVRTNHGHHWLVMLTC